MPIGFGSVTSIGGVGHYCVFHKLRAFKKHLKTDQEKTRVDALYDYWQEHDVKSIYCQDVLNEDTTGRFIDCTYPFMATARLSGMMLDYKKLVTLGINGLIDLIQSYPTNEFMQASLECMHLFKLVIRRQIELVDQCYTKDKALKAFVKGVRGYFLYYLRRFSLCFCLNNAFQSVLSSQTATMVKKHFDFIICFALLNHKNSIWFVFLRMVIWGG